MIKSILVDNREPEWIKQIQFNVPVAISQLDTGDAWIMPEDGSLIIVERKTPTDLLESIKDRRLFNQAARMRELTPWAYVVITAPYTPIQGRKTAIFQESHGWVNTGWDYAAVDGALIEVQEIGVRIAHCASGNDYGPCIVRLANKSRNVIPVLPIRETTVFGGGESVLAALPGIGPTRAMELMRHFPNVAAALWFLTDLQDTQTKIPGIGEAVKRNIVKCLGGSLILNGENNNGQ